MVEAAGCKIEPLPGRSNGDFFPFLTVSGIGAQPDRALTLADGQAIIDLRYFAGSDSFLAGSETFFSLFAF